MTSYQNRGCELTDIQRHQTAVEFARTWEGRGYEKGDTASFWNQLLADVMGMEDVVTAVRYEKHTDDGGFVDVTIADAKTIIEQKSIEVNLDEKELRRGRLVTPFEQARDYANSLPYSLRPRYIIVCNFREFRIHDLDVTQPDRHYLAFTLDELPEQFHLLDFLIDPQRARRQREERVSMDAGALVGKLYQAVRAQYINPDSEENQHALNVLCVRLVFCLFAEDAGLFGKDTFLQYVGSLRPEQIRRGLMDLFDVLDTPLDQRDPYLPDSLKAFPYVNGGLFRQVGGGNTEIPQFTLEIQQLLVEELARNTNWAEISPTIFGGVFESTLNPETRAAGGMHYTSPENIHKVIDPLFLDDLHGELESILATKGTTPNSRKKKLRAFHDKIAGLTFFDPACGSGNFLTETYISLRRIEHKILSELVGDQTLLAFDELTPLKVSLDQFYGLEINDFACSVASTALWIAQLQANIEAQSIVTQVIEDFPLHDAAHIRHGNALRMEWRDVISPAKCNYIIGNPPFLGYSKLSAEQKQDRLAIFGKSGGVLDYVACWHRRAAEFMRGTTCRAAFVSTNSICQGQQVKPLWEPLFKMGITINFAHRTFTWSNEAATQAHVFCIIVGFSYVQSSTKQLWTYRRATQEERADGSPREIGKIARPAAINAYLADAPDVFIDRRMKPLSDVPSMIAGGKPTEGGHLLMTPAERAELIAHEPAAKQWIRKFSMGKEFIEGTDRYCLWLVDCPPQELAHMPLVKERVLAVKAMRENSPKEATQKKAATPWLFDEIRYEGKGTYIGVPKVSSERRRYIPMGFVTDGMIPGDKLYFIPTDSLYIFGVLMSQFHNAFMRAVAGRLKSDYSYGNTTVYNNFVFPTPTVEERHAIEVTTQAVLSARQKYAGGGATLKDLYDPNNDWLYSELTRAHAMLDRAVEAAYGVDFSSLEWDEKETAIVAHLFNLYAQATARTDAP